MKTPQTSILTKSGASSDYGSPERHLKETAYCRFSVWIPGWRLMRKGIMVDSGKGSKPFWCFFIHQMVWIFFLPPILFGCFSSSSRAPTTELRVAAASDLKFCLDEIAQSFQLENSGISVTLQFGSSGSLFAQIMQGAPFDLFLSADTFYPEQLKEKGVISEEGPFEYAIGHLVLWASKENPASESHDAKKLLASDHFKTIVIANPRHAPYGRAAEAALQSMGIHESIRPRLVIAENVAQAAQIVSSRAADAGFLSLATTRSPTLRNQGKIWSIPEESHPPLIQSGAILKSSPEPETAKLFKKFLMGHKSKEILKRYGFTFPKE